LPKPRTTCNVRRFGMAVMRSIVDGSLSTGICEIESEDVSGDMMRRI